MTNLNQTIKSLPKIGDKIEKKLEKLKLSISIFHSLLQKI